jgi:dipeptidyl aminopeptidase/acylaminoacyl peptidase
LIKLWSTYFRTWQTTNLTEQNTGYDRDPAFSPDGKKIAWLSMRRAGNEADKNRLMVYYFDSKFQTEVTQSFDNTVNSFAWAPTSQTIYFIPTVEATKNIYSAREVAGKSGFTFTNLVPVTKGDHDYIGISIQQTADKKQTILVGAKQHYSLPTELFIIDAKGMERQLTYTNKAITDNIAWGNVEKRWVTTTDGKKMLTWVIYPPNLKQNKRYPALLYCQGGPQSPVSQYFSYRWNFQLMAANGYIIIAPNRRGLPGFGSEWNDQIIGDYGGQPMKDLLSATDDAMTIPFIDRNRMGAVGASFGGYSVYWLAGNHNKRFKAFVSHCGMYNMESWYGSTEEMWFANNDNQGPYWNIPRPKNYDASPHKFVKNWDTPILIIHNEKDFRVPLTQGIEAFTAAQSRSIPSKFLYFPDENHWVTKPQNSVMWQRVFFEWLDTYLK